MSSDSRSQLERALFLARAEPLEGARLAESVLAQARENANAELVCKALSVLGHNRFQQGEHARSLENFKEALSLNTDQKHMADLTLMIGANYANLGEIEQAFDYYTEGLRLERKRSNPQGLAFALHHIGSGCRERKDFASAETFVQEALEIYTRLQDIQGEAMCRVTLGLATQEQGKFDEALPILSQALEVTLRARDVRQQILAQLNLGWVYLNLGNVVRAEVFFAETLAQAKRIEGRHYQSWAVGGLGHVERMKGNVSKAVDYFEEALHIALELNLLKGQLMVHEVLCQTYESTGEFQKALEHYKAFHHVERKMLTERVERDMAMMATRLEADAAKREAKQLSESNQRLQHHAAWLEKLSREDSLTGLYNRRYLDAVFREAFANCTDLSLIVVDIDHFKRINDTFSHSFGDAVLCHIAAILRENCRSSDTVARYGGEEFVVVLPETRLEVATEIAERIRVAVTEFDWANVHPELFVTVSLGVAERCNLKTPEQLLSLSDARLYAAKHGGRNRVVYSG